MAWGLGQRRGRAKGHHAPVQQRPPPLLLPLCFKLQRFFFLARRQMHALPGSRALFLGLIIPCGSTVVHCPGLSPGQGTRCHLRCPTPWKLAFHLSEASSCVTRVSAPVILPQTKNTLEKRIPLCKALASQLTPLPLLCKNNRCGLFVARFF